MDILAKHFLRSPAIECLRSGVPELQHAVQVANHDRFAGEFQQVGPLAQEILELLAARHIKECAYSAPHSAIFTKQRDSTGQQMAGVSIPPPNLKLNTPQLLSGSCRLLQRQRIDLQPPPLLRSEEHTS